jgi:2-polyprenyl-3-methyl-5-hydroxy-6-metoxy-1,4-benzoquinol methylase
VAAYLSAQAPDLAIDGTIHPNDEMLFPGGDFAAQSRDDTLALYYRNGFQMCRALEQIVEWRFGGFGNVGALLDFASGYGRLTRFLVHKLPKERITVSEILEEAVDFQTSRFGVDGIASATNPADFECDRQFDVIFAASLFTHMPRETFGAWLHKLVSLLTPRGMLIFSTHSPETFEWSTGVPPADADFSFVPQRYSRFLDANDYGNTYVRERELRAIAGEHSLLHLPRGLSNAQDLNVLVPERDRDFSTLAYDYDPFAIIDNATIAGSKLSINGWVATRSARCGIARLAVEIGGREVAEVTSFTARDDVAAHFRDDHFRDSGWGCTIELRDRPLLLDDVLLLKVTGQCGFEWVIHAETMVSAAMRAPLARATHDAQYRAVLVRAQFEEREAALKTRVASLESELGERSAEAERLAGTIRWMKSSRFWKLREQWWRLRTGAPRRLRRGAPG